MQTIANSGNIEFIEHVNTTLGKRTVNKFHPFDKKVNQPWLIQN